MATKSIRDAASANTSIFDNLTKPHAYKAQDTKEEKGTKDVKDVQKEETRGRQKKYDGPTERFNLNIPKDIKTYLILAAARESIRQERTISPTEYLVNLIREDIAKHKDD